VLSHGLLLSGLPLFSSVPCALGFPFPFPPPLLFAPHRMRARIVVERTRRALRSRSRYLLPSSRMERGRRRGCVFSDVRTPIVVLDQQRGRSRTHDTLMPRNPGSRSSSARSLGFSPRPPTRTRSRMHAVMAARHRVVRAPRRFSSAGWFSGISQEHAVHAGQSRPSASRSSGPPYSGSSPGSRKCTWVSSPRRQHNAMAPWRRSSRADAFPMVRHRRGQMAGRPK